jgi:hypothetical protein
MTTPGKFGNSRAAGRRPPTVTEDINVLALVKGTERYIFLYDDNNKAETLRTLGRYASNPELSFTWYDAAVLSQKIRQQSTQGPHWSANRRFNTTQTMDNLGGEDLL